MVASDKCQPQVVRALEKSGWIVASRPFTLYTAVNTLYADIRARRRGASDEIIIGEIKCFDDDRSLMPELYTSIGQYLIYRHVLDSMGIDSPLYLVIPDVAYHGIFKAIAMPVVQQAGIRLLVVDMKREEIVLWLP